MTPASEIGRSEDGRSKVELVTAGVDVAPVLWALRANPGLWTHAETAKGRATPRYDAIWVRSAAMGSDIGTPTESNWYPTADAVPLRELVYPLMGLVGGVLLGGVVIHKVPAHTTTKPHIATGQQGRCFDTFAIQIDCAPGQLLCYEDRRQESKPGDAYYFNDSYRHWIENPTPFDRITALVSIRTERKANAGRPAPVCH